MTGSTNQDQTKNYIITKLQKEVEGISDKPEFEEIGNVIEIKDGIATVSGLSSLRSMEMVEFSSSVLGVALNLEEDQAGIMVLGDYKKIKAGDVVKKKNQLLTVKVGDQLIGRVIDALGEPIDSKESLKLEKLYPIEKIAPGVMTREGVSKPIQTGIKAIDSMIPIGRGQRELIIGDRQTGKTALAVDTIINQKKGDVVSIYVAIGQKKSKVSQIISELEKRGALENTIVVIAGASDPTAMSYLAPYTGCAIGEYFMDQGKDVLIVYDDLSKHAWAYRQISLILKRPPGREAYPGDVFYLHSRLLERSAKLNDKYGGGSLTALPIIETQAGDVSAYIPTNVISITDGQIYLESDLFYKGIRPALNVGLSVSRVGSAAQIKAMKKVSGKLRLDLAQYKELETFAQLGSELDEKTQKQIDRGQRSVEILKQGQYEPMPVEYQVIILYALGNGFIDDVKVDEIKEWEKNLLKYLETKGQNVVDKIGEQKNIDENLEEEIIKLLKAYNKTT